MNRFIVTSALLLSSIILSSAAPVNPAAQPASSLSTFPDESLFNPESPEDNLTPRTDISVIKYQGLPKDIWLQSVKAKLPFPAPYCFPTSDSHMCTLATRSYPNQTTPELYHYNNKCEIKQDWLGENFPYKGHGFEKWLPGVTKVFQENGEISPSVEYAGVLTEKALCANGGPSDVSPFFRLACWVQYDCSALGPPSS